MLKISFVVLFFANFSNFKDSSVMMSICSKLLAGGVNENALKFFSLSHFFTVFLSFNSKIETGNLSEYFRAFIALSIFLRFFSSSSKRMSRSPVKRGYPYRFTAAPPTKI